MAVILRRARRRSTGEQRVCRSLDVLLTERVAQVALDRISRLVRKDQLQAALVAAG